MATRWRRPPESWERRYGAGENRQQHIEVVRHHLDGHAEFPVELGQNVHGGALAGQIEIGQWLVEHEQLWVRHQGLGYGDALAQAA